jgi:hypothetical protein
MIFLKRAEDLRFVLLNKAAEDLLGLASVRRCWARTISDLYSRPLRPISLPARIAKFSLRKTSLDIAEESISTRNGWLGLRVLHTQANSALRDDDRAARVSARHLGGHYRKQTRA